MKNMVSFKNCFLFTLILFITFSGISVNAESEIPEIETEPLYVSDNSFYFGVFTAETKDEAKNGIFQNVTDETIFYASIQNSGKDRCITLKGYLNYESVPLHILDPKYDQEKISVKDGANIVIPFKIDAEIRPSANYKFLISMFIGVDLHESDTHFGTTMYGTSYDYFIQNQPENIVDLDLISEKPLHYIPFSPDRMAFMINTDFSADTDIIKVPPAELTLKRGEEFSLAYRIGNAYPKAKSCLLLVTMDYQQASINNADYLCIDTRDNYISYGEIKLTAPDQEGKYEICALLVPDPKAPVPFVPLEYSRRFTLTVT